MKEKVLNLTTYEDRMLDAFVQKPEKFCWYKNAFSKYDINGIEKKAWVWNWWAFFTGGLWYLLYRKAYKAAFWAFVLNIVFGLIPVVGILVFYILAGGYSTYFVYKKYKYLKTMIESKIEDEEKRIETMREFGGYNSWVVWLNVFFSVVVFAVFVLALYLNSAGQF